MNSEEEEVEYTCYYGQHKIYDELGNEVKINRKPAKKEFDIEEIKKFVRSVEINAFKEFSTKIEEKLKRKR